MKQWELIAEPKVTQELLTNPGIGFIAAPGLMGQPEKVRDNRGELVEPYKFTTDSKTWNHPDSAVYYAGVSWAEIEPEEGRYNWRPLEEKLEYAKGLGCTAVVRCAPYSLTEDVPLWMRRRWPEEPEFPFWRVDPNTTDYADCWARFIRAFAAHCDGNPLISSVDMALVGAWGEGGGSELVETEKLRQIIRAYTDGFSSTPLQALLHDPISLQLIHETRRNVGFRVDCLGDMGGFHGSEWSHMLDFYPQNIENFGMHDAWEKAPVLFEACWHMNDWYRAGWDIDYIIDESLKWHISSYNSKGTTVPAAWKESVERWVRRMGYRFELRRACARADARELQLELLWANTGVAPCYHAYPVTVRLEGEGGTAEFRLCDDIRNWLPGEDHLIEECLPLPPELPAESYLLRVGILTDVKEIGTLRLAIEGRCEDGYYNMGYLMIPEKEGLK